MGADSGQLLVKPKEHRSRGTTHSQTQARAVEAGQDPACLGEAGKVGIAVAADQAEVALPEPHVVVVFVGRDRWGRDRLGRGRGGGLAFVQEEVLERLVLEHDRSSFLEDPHPNIP